MRRSLSLLLLGAISYALFLFAYMPMSAALKWSGKLPQDVVPYGLRGSILHGEADALLWQNWRADDVRWRFAPWQLLHGHVAYTLHFSIPDGGGSATIGVGLGGATELTDMQLRLPLKYLSRQWSLPTRFDGSIEVDLAEFAIEGGHITAANGDLIWSNARLRADPPVPLGDFQGHIEPLEDADQLSFQGPISDSGGPLSASGALQLQPDGSWQIRGKLSLRDPSSTAIAHLLDSLGRAGADGKVAFNLKDRLPLKRAEPASAK